MSSSCFRTFLPRKKQRAFVPLYCDIRICVTGNFSALTIDAAEPCAPGNLFPMVPLWELDKKQWKTNAFMWLQIKISLCLWIPLSGTLHHNINLLYTCVYLVYDKKYASQIRREIFKVYFIFKCQFISNVKPLIVNIYSETIKEN